MKTIVFLYPCELLVVAVFLLIIVILRFSVNEKRVVACKFTLACIEFYFLVICTIILLPLSSCKHSNISVLYVFTNATDRPIKELS